MSATYPLHMVRSHFGLRTSHNHPIPMLALSNIPREERLQQEAEAKRCVLLLSIDVLLTSFRRKSNEIDEQLRVGHNRPSLFVTYNRLQLEGIAARKRKAKERKILLLGQS